MSDLLDQTPLIALAERLVEAARKAGADTADAVAVRSVSLSVEVRDGNVEETERTATASAESAPALRAASTRRSASAMSGD